MALQAAVLRAAALSPAVPLKLHGQVTALSSVLSFVLGPAAPPELRGQVMELLWLQAALLRRGRLREAAERERRRRQYLRRRRAFVLSSLSAILSLTPPSNRLVWVRSRTPGRNFWAAAASFDDAEWKAQFRVSRATFDYLLEVIGADIKRQRTNYRAPIEPRRRLAITLWYFARSGEYRSIADMFGVGIATVCNIVRQVTAAILKRLYRHYVSLPSSARLDDTVRAFQDRCYPQCAGAIGTTHIPIAAPRGQPGHYLNPRGWHSVILQAVVDHKVCFADVYAGWPGSCDSAAVLRSSDLYLKAEDRPDGYLFPRERSLLLDGVEIPLHLIGDASFPLKPWLMKGYGENHRLAPEQRRFTFTLASARSVVDTAFLQLKGRWRCLLKKSEIDVSLMSRVVAACCVLHNVCERRGDCFLPEWSVEMAPSGTYLIQPESKGYEGEENFSAEVIRDTVAYNLLTILENSSERHGSATADLPALATFDLTVP